MKVEDHDDALARFDVFEPFHIFVVDDQCSLHIGDAPMPGDRLGVRAHETNRPQFNAHVKNSFTNAAMRTALYSLTPPSCPTLSILESSKPLLGQRFRNAAREECT
jgi:hypothetical protein